MAALTRAFNRGTRAGHRILQSVGDELREQRLGLGLSQLHVADACGMSRSRYTRIEAATVPTLSVLELCQLGAVLGLDGSVRLFPGGVPVRDAAHAERLQRVLAAVRPPLSYRVEVPLPRLEERSEQRAWDAMLFGHEERTAIELEMRLRDVQAMRRRHDLKRRDDPTEGFLLLIADTRSNRRVLREFEALFADLPRLATSRVRSALAAGSHPPSGLLLV